MASVDNSRNRGRHDPEPRRDELVELARYQSWAEVDMLAPRLEDGDIRYEVRELVRNPDERPDGVEPRTTIQVVVARRDVRQAREVLDDFESQRDVTNFEIRARPEPEDIGRDEDMKEPPAPKMKF